MSPEPPKAQGRPEPHDSLKVEAAVKKDPHEDGPPNYQVDKTPPNLEVKKTSDRQPDTTEEEWRLGSPLDGEAPCPEDWAAESRWNLGFAMMPDRWIFFSEIREWFKTIPERDWCAMLKVNAKNIPGLMRDGFHWSSANVVPGRGFILLDERDLLKKKGLGFTNCKHMRTYKLRGNESTGIEWRGTLEVYAKSSSTLINFDLNWLTQDNIGCAKAYDWNSKPVYSYYSYEESKNFNVVYEGMPLKGFWPWPKAALPPRGDFHAGC